VLTVSSSTNTSEVVTFHNTLETTTLRSSDSIDEVSFNEDILNTDLFSKFRYVVELDSEVTEFSELLLRRSVCLFEVANSRLGGIFLFLLAISELNSTVSVCFFIFHLCYYTGTGFYHRASDVLALRAEYAGHSYFLSYNSRHG